MKILYRGIFIATLKRTYIQDQARPIIVTSLLSYETSPYFSWREKSLLPKFLSQLEPCWVDAQADPSLRWGHMPFCWFCHGVGRGGPGNEGPSIPGITEQWAKHVIQLPHDNVAVRPVKTQISLGIRSDQSSLCAQWVAKDPGFLHADSEDSGCDFAGRTCHFVGFVMRRLNYKYILSEKSWDSGLFCPLFGKCWE